MNADACNVQAMNTIVGLFVVVFVVLAIAGTVLGACWIRRRK